MTKDERGKAGKFDTRANPFTGTRKPMGSLPNFTEIPNATSAIQAVISASCAIIVGSTRDGGAVVFTVLDGDQRHRTYCSTEQELQDAVNALIDMYQI